MAGLAAAAGLSRQYVHALEVPPAGRPVPVPSWPTVVALAAALGVPTDTFR